MALRTTWQQVPFGSIWLVDLFTWGMPQTKYVNLLHFNYYDTAISRSDYITKLSELLGRRYKKNSETIYEEIERRQNDAIRNAQKLLEQYSPPNPAQDNPSTTVHLLVEQLDRFVRYGV